MHLSSENILAKTSNWLCQYLKNFKVSCSVRWSGRVALSDDVMLNTVA